MPYFIYGWNYNRIFVLKEENLKGYVITLQNFDKLITEWVKNGSIVVSENTIETENTFDIWKQ